MFFSSNIKYLRRRRGRTQGETASSLEIKRSTLSGYENNVAQPGLETLIKFSEYFNISLDTLIKTDLRELSEMQISELERGFDVYIKGKKLRVLATTVDPENNENIELVNEKAKAGYKRGYADTEFISELPAFQLPFLSENRKYRAFQISGDSMKPVPEGSYIIGEYLQDWNLVQSGKTYIIVTKDEGLVFKRVNNKISESGSLELISDNEEYERYSVKINDISEIWKSHGYITMDFPDKEYFSAKELSKSINEIKEEIKRLKG